MTKTSTKQRISATALELFNQLGAPNISTNHIALELDISPGNLYYHYKNKEKLIEKLFAEYEQALAPLLTQKFDESLNIEDVWFFLHFSFELALQYRFIYQDTDYILLKSPSLVKKYQRLLQKLNNALLALLDQLSATGVMITDSRPLMENLALNMLLVCTQWIPFSQHLSGAPYDGISGHNLNQGVYQVLSLLLPYLAPADQVHLTALREEYR